jgi:2-keto-4-pentenoate hydratase/2-oxohepta-3-ene-1,7-dioic acid hydratase in catechol pathway
MNILRKDQNKILGLAKNYLKQYIEKGGKDLPTHPLIFEKPWSSILFEPNPVKINSKENRFVDHESILNIFKMIKFSS